MPKAMLKFNLPEEEYAFKAASNAVEIVGSASDFREFLRGITKYRDLKSDEARELAEEIYRSFLEEFSVALDIN